jgi:hypothetical protein
MESWDITLHNWCTNGTLYWIRGDIYRSQHPSAPNQGLSHCLTAWPPYHALCYVGFCGAYFLSSWWRLSHDDKRKIAQCSLQLAIHNRTTSVKIIMKQTLTYSNYTIECEIHNIIKISYNVTIRIPDWKTLCI